jgi:hypothetical protein
VAEVEKLEEWCVCDELLDRREWVIGNIDQYEVGDAKGNLRMHCGEMGELSTATFSKGGKSVHSRISGSSSQFSEMGSDADSGTTRESIEESHT